MVGPRLVYCIVTLGSRIYSWRLLTNATIPSTDSRPPPLLISNFYVKPIGTILHRVWTVRSG